MIQKGIPELPNQKAERFIKEYGLTDYNAEILTRDLETAHYFEKTIGIGKEQGLDPRAIANYIINKKPNLEEQEPDALVSKIKEETTVESFDETKLSDEIQKILNGNAQSVADYKAGKVQLLGFFIGQVRRALPEAKDAEQIRNLLIKMLE